MLKKREELLLQWKTQWKNVIGFYSYLRSIAKLCYVVVIKYVAADRYSNIYEILSR